MLQESGGGTFPIKSTAGCQIIGSGHFQGEDAISQVGSTNTIDIAHRAAADPLCIAVRTNDGR